MGCDAFQPTSNEVSTDEFLPSLGAEPLGRPSLDPEADEFLPSLGAVPRASPGFVWPKTKAAWTRLDVAVARAVAALGDVGHLSAADLAVLLEETLVGVCRADLKTKAPAAAREASRAHAGARRAAARAKAC